MTPAALTRLALKLADEHAANAFRSQCYAIDCARDGWRIVPPYRERDGYLRDALRYLRARKMLERDGDLWRVRAAK